MRPGTPYWQILAVAVVMGVASSFVWGPLATSANRNLPMAMAGAGSGVYNTTRQMGSVLGSAAIAALMTARVSVHLPGAGSAVEQGRLPVALQGPYAQALAESMLLPGGVLLVGWVAALFFENARHLTDRREPMIRAGS